MEMADDQMIDFLPLFPAEITTDIISRLPVDSVIQCKRVCKTWQPLMDAHKSRRLISSSASAAAASYGFLMRLKLSNHVNQFHIGEYYDMDENKVAPGNSPFKLITKQITTRPVPFPFPVDRNWDLVSSSNGLICLVTHSKDPQNYNVCICNPLTREYVNLLPCSQLINPSSKHRQWNPPQMTSFVVTGFGYHPCTNEYKVVRMLSVSNPYRGRYDEDRHVTVSVYTLGSGTWRNKGELSTYTRRAAGVLFNGALHWLKRYQNEILLFNLEDEEFRTIPLPPFTAASNDDDDDGLLSFRLEDGEFRTIIEPSSPHRHSYYRSNDDEDDEVLGMLGGCLCVTRDYWCNGSKDIWIMNKDYCSWTKNFRIPTMYTKGGLISIISTPIDLLKDDKILLSYDYMKFACYDPKAATLKTIAHSINLRWLRIECHEMIPYTRSFVSLKALGEKNVNVAVTRKRKRSREVRI